MRSKLETGDTQARKAQLRQVISHSEVDDQKIFIIGNKANLGGLITDQSSQQANVRGFVSKWRTGVNEEDSNYYTEIIIFKIEAPE